MKKSLEGLKKQKGITLVALIITVVVMLILAGVAIAAIVDTDGLFQRSQDAANRYEQATKDEANQMQGWINVINNYLEGLPVDDNPVVKDKAEIGIVVDDNQTFDGRLKGTYDNPIIPKGFSPENENDATWGTENGWQKGLVIKDESGNEFVWVPVDGTIIKFERQDWRNSKDELLTLPENTTIGVDMATQYVETIPSEITTSVNNNGGFYIARYEAGYLSDTVVSKKETTVYNNIDWNTSKTIAEGMYPSPNDNYGAISTLIYGAQWDAALKFIQIYSGDSNYPIDSEGKGNYSGTSGEDDIESTSEPAVCGAREAFRKNNIYDMAGNVREWTMEQYDSKRVRRGGGFNVSAITGPASFRNANDTTTSSFNIGFRVALYIK